MAQSISLAQYQQLHSGEPLTADEAARLAECESVIERSFVFVGAALRAIHDEKLYREHGTWENYCQERWQIGRARSYQLMAAGEVVEHLSTIVDILPANEGQVRPLLPLSPADQETVWRVVTETAPDGRVTEAHVRSVVNVFKEVLVTGALDGAGGEQVAVHDLVKAAVTEETYERTQRQQQHLRDRALHPRQYVLKAQPGRIVEPTADEVGLVLVVEIPLLPGTAVDALVGQSVTVSLWMETETPAD